MALQHLEDCGEDTRMCVTSGSHWKIGGQETQSPTAFSEVTPSDTSHYAPSPDTLNNTTLEDPAVSLWPARGQPQTRSKQGGGDES